MMKRFTRSLRFCSLLFTFLLLSFIGKAQIIDITNTANPSSASDAISLITNTFISGGVQIDTIIYTGNAQQVGFFTNGTNAIGIENGIVMSSGNAESGIGPNTATNTTTTKTLLA